MCITLHFIGDYKHLVYPHQWMLEIRMSCANASHAYRNKEQSEISSEIIFLFWQAILGSDAVKSIITYHAFSNVSLFFCLLDIQFKMQGVLKFDCIDYSLHWSCKISKRSQKASFDSNMKNKCLLFSPETIFHPFNICTIVIFEGQTLPLYHCD